MRLGVVTLSFNQGSFLEEAILSVTVSGEHTLEYVIIDPGSRDDSRAIIEKHRNAFASAILEADEGPADGLNKGFAALSEADIYGYLNADDRFCPGALNYVCDYFARNPGKDILLGSIYIIDAQGKRRIRARHVNRITLRDYAQGACSIWQQATFFRRSSFSATAGFNLANRTCWDSELVIDMILAGAQVGYTARPLGEFRIHANSITGSNNATQFARFRADHERVKTKIYSSGVAPQPGILGKAANAFHRFSLYRYAADFALGTRGLFTVSE